MRRLVAALMLAVPHFALADVLTVEGSIEKLEFTTSDILRAEAGADMNGRPSAVVSLALAATARYTAFTLQHVGQEVTISICNVEYWRPTLLTPIETGFVMIHLPPGQDMNEMLDLLHGVSDCPADVS